MQWDKYLLVAASAFGIFQIPNKVAVCRKKTFALMVWVFFMGWVIVGSSLGELCSDYTVDT